MRLLVTYGPMLAVAALIAAVFVVRFVQAHARGEVGGGLTVAERRWRRQGRAQKISVGCPGCGHQVLVRNVDDPSAQAPLGRDANERICPQCKTAINIASLPPMPD